MEKAEEEKEAVKKLTVGGGEKGAEQSDEVKSSREEVWMDTMTSVKPCLKTKTSLEAVKKPMRSGSVRWNEEEISLHDEERGTRTKIDEPNTPFRRMDSTSDIDDSSSTEIEPQGIEPSELMARLNSLEEGGEEEDAAGGVGVYRRPSFEERRKCHYGGEYKAVLRAATLETSEEID